MREISEIWIIAPNGITVFNLQKDSNLDAVLMGGFFSAIHNFVSEIGESELKSLEPIELLFQISAAFPAVAQKEVNHEWSST